MLLSTKGVRAIALQVACKLGVGHWSTWTDKARDESVRLLSWRLWDVATADKFAQELQARLQADGWTNKVVRTSTADCYSSRTAGGEYVRVRAQSTTSGSTVLE